MTQSCCYKKQLAAMTSCLKENTSQTIKNIEKNIY